MTNGNLIKPVFVISILVFSIVGLGFIIQDVSADHGVDPGITTPVVAGANTISFRDISNMNPQTSTLTLDQSPVQFGFFNINLEELDANLDSTVIDTVIATASSTSSDPLKATVTLTETDVNTGIFSGQLILSTTQTVGNTLEVHAGDVITIDHEEEAQGIVRAEVVLNLLTPGNVKITDVLIDTVNEAVNQPFIPQSHGVKIELLDGATLDPANPPKVTLSYANLDLGGEDPEVLSMYYDPGAFDAFVVQPGILEPVCNVIPGGVWEPIAATCSFVFPNVDGGWEQITDPVLALPASHDTVAMTVTSDVANSDFGALGKSLYGPLFVDRCCPTSATFMLGFQTGSIGGGGGGGLVRPGFVVNALAGANVISSFFGKSGTSGECDCTSSGAGPSKPAVTAGTVSILSDESIGFAQQGVTSDSEPASNSFDSTQNVGIGKDLTFKYDVYENTGPDNIIHSTMYFFDAEMMDANDRINVGKSETYIMFEKGKPVKVVDPYGYFEKAAFEVVPTDTFTASLKYDITFAKTMPESHIVLRTWDADKYSTDTLYENALVVNENSIINNDDSSQDNEPLTQSEFETSPFLDTQYENPLAEEETSTKTGFPGIPLWVKNNAMWWHEKQIDDADFVAGIQYMINEEIITITETEITNSAPEEIPQWISTIAGYWSNDQIPDDEFVQVVQWLVSNGVMKVV